MVASWYIVRASYRYRVVRWLSVALVLAWTASGLLTHIHEINSRDSLMLSEESVAFGHRLQALIPPDSIVACQINVHPPVAVVAGREVVMAYDGWVNSWGLPWRQEDNDLRAMLDGYAERRPAAGPV